MSKCWFEGNRLGGEEKHRGPCCKKDQERQGYTFSEREPQRRDESARGGLRMKEMKCVLERGWCMEKRISLNANSSHLERLTDREQHFCTYPGSLPPHSITRQSIKSSKKRHWLKLQGYDAAFCCFTAFILTCCVLILVLG